MASWREKEGEEDLGSLFEGMVLIDPFSSHDHTTAATSVAVAAEEEEEEERGGGENDDNDDDEDGSIAPPHPSADSQQQQQRQQQQSEPLDENLFSDLTLAQALSSDPPEHNNHPLPLPKKNTTTPHGPTTTSTTSSSTTTSSSSSRKKKRGGFRIGYARDTPESPDTKLPHPPSPPNDDCDGGDAAAVKIHASTTTPSLPDSISDPIPNLYAPHESPPPTPVASSSPDIGIPSENKSTAQGDTSTSTDPPRKKTPLDSDTANDATDIDLQIKASQQQEEEEQDDNSFSIEESLDTVRRRVSQKLERIRETASSLSTARKESVRRRRKASEDVNSASLSYKDMEKELEEACEAEDFERAERLSENLAAADKDKEAFIRALREAEAECTSVESKMREVLELQITTEEEGASMLEAFARDAADGADLILRNAEEFSSKGMEEWLSSTEALEIKKMELDIESHLINEARSGLKDSIEILIEDDRKEKELLIEKRDALTDELDKLLVLVRLKEAEIAENNYKIEEVEKKIANVMSEFQTAQSSIDLKYDDLQRVCSQIEFESEALSLKKKEVDDFNSEMERKRSKLRELASVCANEAKACQELASLRKCLASSVLKSMQDKANLAETEERILEDVKMLRQLVSASRASLQELSSTRARIQQEVASFKQRIGFIDKRGPELEAEKKVAAAAWNFKEAGRIAAEAKALGTEKEELRDKMEVAIFELDKVETEIKDTVNKLQESERLISSKEKEAAIAGCERLQLVATAAMAERTAALEMGDLEEADILLAEAEAANLEATKLQQAFEFELEEMGRKANYFISMALIANLAGKELAEMAASIRADAV
ncbi:hypothetical protein AAC387_Pa03g4657 [Persea americana]